MKKKWADKVDQTVAAFPVETAAKRGGGGGGGTTIR